MKRALTLLCSFAIVFSLTSCSPAAVPEFEYNCLGKNGTCPAKQSNPLDFFCAACDPDHDNIEGIKKAGDPSEDISAPEASADASAPSEESSSDAAQKPSSTPSASENESEDSEEPVPAATAEEERAVKAAKSLLASGPLSRGELIKQLKAKKFSAKDAAYAADHCGADWNKLAEKAAAKYLTLAPFALNTLIQQLELDGYSSDQAEKGATAAYNAPMSSYPARPIVQFIEKTDG